MIIQKNVNLSQYTTVKIGGVAKLFYIPENIDELVDLVCSDLPKPYYIISGGSNILMNDAKIFDSVVYLKELDNNIVHLGDGTFYCGASCRIQKVIKMAQDEGYGGIEFLYSLPAMVGGIVYMNAGRSKKAGVSISDFIIEVYAIKDGKRITIPKAECNFSYRGSVFQNGGYIITGVMLQLVAQSTEETEKRIEERLELCKKVQDHSGTTFGTVFADADARLLKLCAKVSHKKGITWSRMKGNWLVNDGTGNFKQAIKLINRCKFIHKICHKKIRSEVCIWE